MPRWLAPAVLVASVAITLTVPLFSYLRGGWLTAALAVLTVGRAGVRRAADPARARRGRAAYGLAVATHVALAAVAIVGDTAPRIDVWVVLQQGADALGRGENVYTQQWTDSPGVQDFFPYLPWMAVLTAPGRWLAGDVRWAVLFWSLVLFAGLWALARGRVERAAAVTAVLVLAPGTLTQVDQAWTEPVLAALIVWWAVLVRRGQAWWAVVPLALACASKQHLALLAPVLLVWRPFGAWRTLATGALAAVLMLPWVLADAGAFVGDTVTTLLTFHPIRFANTWYLYALNEHGVTLPFWVTGAAMVGVVAVAAYAVWRRRPGVDELLRWLALVLAVANLVNKQAFYNQYWLVGALVAASLALPQGEPAPSGSPAAASRPTRRAGRPRAVGAAGQASRRGEPIASTRRSAGCGEAAEARQPLPGELGPGGAEHRWRGRGRWRPRRRRRTRSTSPPRPAGAAPPPRARSAMSSTACHAAR